MGQPAYSNAIVRFDTCANATLAVEAFQKWAELADNRTLPEPPNADKDGSINGDYCIEDIGQGEDNEVTFTVSSPRYQNCIWQCENIRDFFAKQEGCQSFEADVMTCEDSVNWYREEDEIDKVQNPEVCAYCGSGLVNGKGECQKCGL